MLQSLAASWARTTPATVFQSAMPMAAWPSCAAVATSSGGAEAPRRKEKKSGGELEFAVGLVHDVFLLAHRRRSAQTPYISAIPSIYTRAN